MQADPRGEASPNAARVTLTVTEAANMLGISRSTAYELVQVGTLPSLRLGRRIVVPIHAMTDLLESAVIQHERTQEA
jgi:excisionase family DNA binding protein